MKENTDQTGGLFAALPMQMKGNIRCTTNSDRPIIGYIDVATTTQATRYYDHWEMVDLGLYEADGVIASCDPEISARETYFQGAAIYMYESVSGLILSYIPQLCVDCRILGGSKNRPSDWPNDHY